MAQMTATEKQRYLEEFEQEFQRTRRVLAAYPKDKLDLRPHPKSKSAMELGWMLVLNQYVVIPTLTQAELTPGGLPTIPGTWPEILSTFDAAHRDAVAHDGAESDGRLAPGRPGVARQGAGPRARLRCRGHRLRRSPRGPPPLRGLARRRPPWRDGLPRLGEAPAPARPPRGHPSRSAGRGVRGPLSRPRSRSGARGAARAHRPLRRRRGLPRGHARQAARAAALRAGAPAGIAGAVVLGHRRHPRARLGRARRPGLDRQALGSDLPAIWLVVPARRAA